GVRRYLLKPISFAELSETVQEMVNEIAEQKRAAAYPAKAEEKSETAEVSSDGARSVESSEAIVGAVKAYVALHFEEPIGRQEIEDALHLNGDYLNRTFKAATGYSLIQYIQFYRVVTAKQLMREPHAAIAEIGSRVGMDASYFGKIFKKWTGQTPYEYYAQIHGKKEV
ncbi:MAG: DNA-binding response regulator, partial [Lachnospiraceae bacterium]|nr:DNA-binding response regulator [Lachnospiraceae bacterium]